MGTLCCWAVVGAVAAPEAGPELSEGAMESCSAVLQRKKYKYKNIKKMQCNVPVPVILQLDIML